MRQLIYQSKNTVYPSISFGRNVSFEKIEEILSRVTLERDDESWNSYCEYCMFGGDLQLCSTCNRTYHEQCFTNYHGSMNLDEKYWVCSNCLMNNDQLQLISTVDMRKLKLKMATSLFGFGALVKAALEAKELCDELVTIKKGRTKKKKIGCIVRMYTQDEMIKKVANWRKKRKKRCFKKTIRYQVRKMNADSRLRVNGKFI